MKATHSTSSKKNTAKRGRARSTKPAQPAEPEDPVTAYARDVVDRRIVACSYVRLACERHLRDLETAAARGFVFDLAKAMRAIKFFPAVLRHYKGKWAKEIPGGLPFFLSPWQKFIVGSIFGWVRVDSGLRRFGLAYLELARKNGKSALAAGIGLMLFIFDDEPGAEVYAAATKRDQARIVWGDAAAFVRKSPTLRKRVQRFTHSLMAPASDSVFLPLSADANTMDGLNPHGVVIDELHKHKSRAIVDVMETAQGAREQPLQIEITTAGDDVEGVCWEHHDYSVKVLEGTLEDDKWFAYIAGLDKGDDWKDEKVWVKANPNLGVSVHVEALREQISRAANQPAAQRAVKRLRLNIWTEEAGGWMEMARWNACARDDFNPEILKGRECVAGLDLSATTDITAYVELYPPTKVDPLYRVLPFFWVPEAKIRDAREGKLSDRVRYDLWFDRGLVFATEGDVVDYSVLQEFIVGRKAQASIAEIGFDPWNATQLAQGLAKEGFVTVEVRQGYKTLSEPTKKVMALTLGRELAHDGNAVLRWMISNVAIVKDDADNHKPSKRLSRQRIDGATALIIAESRLIAREGQKSTVSIYATRGMQTT
jgi:phage terminase large subunit-like protein